MLHDHFPTRAAPNLISIRPGYPYGLALVGLAVSRIVGDIAGSAGIVWSALLLLAVACCCAEFAACRIADHDGAPPSRTQNWICAAFGLLAGTLLSPSFVSKLAFSNYGDVPLGSIIGILAWWAAMWCVESGRGRRRFADVLVGGFAAAAAVGVRQDGLEVFLVLFGAICVACLLERYRFKVPGMSWALALPLLALVAVPLAQSALWGHYVATAMPHGDFHIMPIAQWHWAEMPSALRHVLIVVVHKLGHFGLLALVTAATVVALLRPPCFTARQRLALLLGTAVGLGNCACIVLAYLVANFSPGEIAVANSFWRLTMHAGAAVVIAGIALVPVGLFRARWVPRQAYAPLLALIALLPFFAAPMLRNDVSAHSDIPYLRAVARSTAALAAGAPRITLVDLQHESGYLPIIFPMHYELLVADRHMLSVPPGSVAMLAGPDASVVVIHGALPAMLPPREQAAARRRALSAPFVWFANGGATASALAGISLAPGASYLLAHNAHGLAVVRRWPFGSVSAGGGT